MEHLMQNDSSKINENDDPNRPGPSKTTNQVARRGRKSKRIIMSPIPRRSIHFTTNINSLQSSTSAMPKCSTIDNWIINSKGKSNSHSDRFSVVDLEEEEIGKEDIPPGNELFLNQAKEKELPVTPTKKTPLSPEKKLKENCGMEEDGGEKEDNEIEIDENDGSDKDTDGIDEKRKKMAKLGEKVPPAPIYTDLEGNEWNLLDPTGYLEKHYPLLGMEKLIETNRNAIYKCVHRYDSLKCPYLMLFLKKKKICYQRFEHSHQVKTTLSDLLNGVTLSPSKEGEDVDFVNKMEYKEGWKCVKKELANEDELAEIIEKEGMKRAKDDEICRRYVCRERPCGFKIRWMKRRAELWTLGVHNRHPAIPTKWPKKRRK